MTTNDFLTGPLTIPLTDHTPALDGVTGRLGFTPDDLRITPRPVSKRQRHRARRAALAVQNEVFGVRM